MMRIRDSVLRMNSIFAWRVRGFTGVGILLLLLLAGTTVLAYTGPIYPILERVGVGDSVFYVERSGVSQSYFVMWRTDTIAQSPLGAGMVALMYASVAVLIAVASAAAFMSVGGGVLGVIIVGIIMILTATFSGIIIEAIQAILSMPW